MPNTAVPLTQPIHNNMSLSLLLAWNPLILFTHFHFSTALHFTVIPQLSHPHNILPLSMHFFHPTSLTYALSYFLSCFPFPLASVFTLYSYSPFHPIFACPSHHLMLFQSTTHHSLIIFLPLNPFPSTPSRNLPFSSFLNSILPLLLLPFLKYFHSQTFPFSPLSPFPPCFYNTILSPASGFSHFQRPCSLITFIHLAFLAPSPSLIHTLFLPSTPSLSHLHLFSFPLPHSHLPSLPRCLPQSLTHAWLS